jgi:opacity protein-like surface antigen
MKRIHMALVLTVVLAVAAFVPMASASPVGLGTLELNAGYAKSSTEVMPNGDSFGGGITFGAAYWRSMSPSVSWGGELSFDNLGSVDYDNGTTTDNKISASAFRVNPAVRFNFGAPVGPSFYAQGGAGLYSVSSKREDSDPLVGNSSDSQSKFGFNIGAGVSFPVGPKSRMNFTGLYHSVSTDVDNTNYMQFRAGFGFGL